MRPALAEKRKVKQSDVMVKHSAGGAVPPAGWNPSPFRSADGSCRCRRGARQLLLVLGLVLSGALVNPLQAQDSPAPPATPGETGTEKLSQPPAELTPEELAAWQDRRAAAVALNFSRMSFHRIRRNPSRRILLEEQQHILNNLNLNGIADEEVVRLYTSVLAEITEVQIAEHERKLIEEQFRREVTASTVVNAYALAGQIAEGHYIAAVKTGVRSWWDYRGLQQHRDLDEWKVDRKQMLAVVDKSAQFLDTFWKLTRRREIPDRWLVRDTDLDRLEEAVRIADPEVRLRVLLRMRRFMECCPPWWYYVGRTQQQLGQLFAAAETYRQLESQASGHFRKDRMLAAGTANLAMIEDFLGQQAAAETARRALIHASDVWEVNVACARVLLRNARFEEAAEAVLRNLDSGLETRQSLTMLLIVHRAAGNRVQMLRALNRPETATLITVPVLLECLAWLGFEETPPSVIRRIHSTLQADAELSFGRDNLVVMAAGGWQLHEARAVLELGGQEFAEPQRNGAEGWQRLRFRNVGELGSPIRAAVRPPLTLSLVWPDSSLLRLQLEYRAARNLEARDSGSATDSLVALLTPSHPTWQIVTAELAGQVIDFDRRSVRQLEPQPESGPSLLESPDADVPAAGQPGSLQADPSGPPASLVPLQNEDLRQPGPQFPAGAGSKENAVPSAGRGSRSSGAHQVRFRPAAPGSQRRWQPAPARPVPVRPAPRPPAEPSRPTVRPF